MLEPHIRAQYRLYNHKGYWSRLGSMDYVTHQYTNQIVFGEEEVVKHVRLWDGKRNCFISRGARNQDGSIHHISVLTFDLDPIRPKEVASSDEQHSNALIAGRRILAKYPGGYLASSGNGALLIYRVTDIADYVQHYAREAVLIKELQLLVNDLGIKIDGTNYQEAITKSIGSTSTKGELSMRRVSRFIQVPIPPYTNSSKLLQRLDEIKPEQSVAVGCVDVGELRSKFNGDRSTADFHLVNYLHKSGVGPEVAAKLLETNPLGRQDDQKDQGRLIAKIYGKAAIRSSGELKENYFDRLFQADSESEQLIKSGFSSLDACIRALPKGEITTVSARSGFGKSSFACTIAEILRSNNKRVLYFSTEMESDYITHKFVAVATDIPLSKFIEKSFSEEDKERINAYKSELLRTPIIVCDEFQPTIELVRNKTLEHKPDLLVFDHASQAGVHWEYVAQFARGLKELATQENIPVLLLSQLNEPPRTKDGGVMQSLRGDVRGSQELIFLSAIFIVMNNLYDVKTDIQPVKLNICKNRYGLSGQEIELNVNKTTGKFFTV